MIVTNKNGKTLLDKAVDEEEKVTKDVLWVTIKLKGGYELSFTLREWAVVHSKRRS